MEKKKRLILGGVMLSVLLLLLTVSIAIALNIRKKAIERLSKEVAECERMVKEAFDLAQPFLPTADNESDYVNGTPYVSKNHQEFFGMINALPDEASAGKVSDLNRSVANLMLKKLHLGMQRGDKQADLEKLNSLATSAKQFYQYTFLLYMEYAHQLPNAYSALYFFHKQLGRFWKKLVESMKLHKEMEGFFKECAAWLEEYRLTFSGSRFDNPAVKDIKEELDGIKTILKN